MSQPEQPPVEIPVVIVVAAAALGIVAALVVWFLERFESRRMHHEIGHFLARYAEFQEWEQNRGGGA